MSYTRHNARHQPRILDYSMLMDLGDRTVAEVPAWSRQMTVKGGQDDASCGDLHSGA